MERRNDCYGKGTIPLTLTAGGKNYGVIDEQRW